MSELDDFNRARQSIDRIDESILDLLAERNRHVQTVADYKQSAGLPVFAADRENEKTARFRQQAEERGLAPDWAEDFLRMIMSAARESQSEGFFPCATEAPKKVLIVGGAGGMGRLYGHFLAASGHTVHSIDKDNWGMLDTLAADLDLAVVTVPIDRTTDVIRQLAPHLSEKTVLADFTSHKQGPLEVMLSAHQGPVIGLHPMHGPDVPNLSRQLLLACPGRDAESAAWFLEQAHLWGMRVIEADPARHDHVMDLVQGLRHFLALLHGSFMRAYDLDPGDILQYSSPVYRAELMMTGRIFAQNPALYADIVFATPERRNLLLDFFKHHERLADLVQRDDREGFIREFQAVNDFFDDFAETALKESGYLINRLADRFA